MISTNIRESSAKKIKEIMDDINSKIDEKDKKYIFWCPKDFKDSKAKTIRKGYALNAYGGVVTTLYEVNRRVTCSMFNEDYGKYFGENEEEISNILADISDAPYSSSEGKKIKTDILCEIDKCLWKKIMTGFKQRAERIQDLEKTADKEYLERDRETAISALNADINNIYIVTMEMYAYLDNGKNPRADMVGIRKNGERYMISFTEYKCTDGGLTGVTLKEHFEDMNSYYMDPDVKDKIFEYINRIQLVEGIDFSDVTKENTDTEILFLYSHVDKLKGMSKSLLKKHQDELRTYINSLDKVNYPREIIIDDENTKLKFV